MGELVTARATLEAQWGTPVTTLDLTKLRHGELFAVQKASALAHLRRKPSEVVDMLVPARGTVAGQAIAERQLFVQRFMPIGKWSGRIVVVSPEFQKTGRDVYEPIQVLNRAGHEVLVMDHQWTGQSSGKPDTIDRGYGVARDVAVVAARAQALLEEEHGGNGSVCLYGDGMGAGAGIFSMLVLYGQGLIDLSGLRLPAIEAVVLQDPFFGLTPSPVTTFVDMLSGVKTMNPINVSKPKNATTRTAVLEDVRARLAAMRAASEDLAAVRAMVLAGARIGAKAAIIQARHDALADQELTTSVAKTLNIEIQWVDATTPRLEQRAPATLAVMLASGERAKAG